jgi:hypothetical protein
VFSQKKLNVGRKERVFGHQHDRLLLFGLEDVVGNILLVYHKSEHILAEPLVGHYDAAAGTAVGMMLPKNRTMRQAGRNITSAAAEKLSEAADAVERKML